MSGTLLAHLFPHIRGSQEDVATISICHIIAQSDVLRKAFTKQLSSRLHIPMDDSLSYNSQVAGRKKERPDIVGTKLDGTETIICEAKFYAALTENQPNAYLQRLDGIPDSGLIFLCPQTRIIGLWKQLESLISNFEMIDTFCDNVSGIHMAIISWSDVLDTLLETARKMDPGMLDDIHQLIGFCHEMENTEFIPFKPEDFGVDVAKSQDRYYMVVDSINELLLRQKEYSPSKNGLRAAPQKQGYAQYIKLHDLCCGVFFDRVLWKKASSFCTPFWFYLTLDWKQTPGLMSYFNSLPVQMTEVNRDGKTYIALETPTACTLEETAKALCDQILQHVDAVINMNYLE